MRHRHQPITKWDLEFICEPESRAQFEAALAELNANGCINCDPVSRQWRMRHPWELNLVPSSQNTNVEPCQPKIETTGDFALAENGLSPFIGQVPFASRNKAEAEEDVSLGGLNKIMCDNNFLGVKDVENDNNPFDLEGFFFTDVLLENESWMF